MKHRVLGIVGIAILAGAMRATPLVAQSDGPYARIATLRPHDGDTVAVNGLIARMTVEILTLRPTMSYGLSPARE